MFEHVRVTTITITSASESPFLLYVEEGHSHLV